jgi:hypothetical protein
LGFFSSVDVGGRGKLFISLAFSSFCLFFRAQFVYRNSEFTRGLSLSPEKARKKRNSIAQKSNKSMPENNYCHSKRLNSWAQLGLSPYARAVRLQESLYYSHTTMDIAGDLSSIWTLVQLAGAIIEYIRDAIGAPRERENLAKEIQATATLLNGLNATIILPQWRAILEAPHGPLEQFRGILRHVESKLRPSSKWNSRVKNLIWHFTKSEVQNLLSVIERIKSLLALALQNNNL